jgi:hypothetical protein
MTSIPNRKLIGEFKGRVIKIVTVVALEGIGPKTFFNKKVKIILYLD